MMPINSKLPEKKFPMKLKFGEEVNLDFLNSVRYNDVTCIQEPRRADVLHYLAPFALATWEDLPTNSYTDEQRDRAIKDLFEFKLLPGAMETIRFTFLLANIDLIDVTHLIRHRTFTFSAHCTGDRDQRQDRVMVKPSIDCNEKFNKRYTDLMEASAQLYADMVDSKEVSILDARTVLPRSFANHYYASANLKDLIPFFKQRLDKQIQPESDNLIALKMLIKVAAIFPEIGSIIKLKEPDHYYIKTAQTDHSSNLYQPEKKNDTFEWNPQWFIYPCKRSEMPGAHSFNKEWGFLSLVYNTLVGEFL